MTPLAAGTPIEHAGTANTAAPAPQLVFDHVNKAFGRSDGSSALALADVSLSIDDHKFVAVIGPSGCGKTTLLRIANGLIVPDAGTVSIKGRPPVPGPDTGFVFQGFRLIPWATVLGNVEFALETLDLSASERRDRANTYLELVGLTRWATSYPGQLSGGMKQRVALARALAGEPQMLLMDEPFASLDAQTRELMQIELLHIWNRRKPTVLFVTHSVDEALLLADTVVLMSTGRILEVIDVPLARPRQLDAARSDQDFITLRNHLWNRIRDLVLTDPASAFFGRELNQ